MPNNVLTLDYVTEEVLINLGNTGIEVELENKDYQASLKQAVRIYNRSRPRVRRDALPVTAAQKQYVIDHPNLKGVSRVEFLDQYRLNRTQLDPFDPYSYLGARDFLSEGMTFGQYDQELQHLEMTRRIISAEPEWRGMWDANATTGEPIYYLYVDVLRSWLCSYEYTWHLTPDDNPQTGLRWVDDGDVDWIIDYTTSRCKQILSRVRGKFQGITGPDGSEQPVDWSELMQEGREDEERLREEMKKRMRPLPPVLG